jgi:hypothetical protein
MNDLGKIWEIKIAEITTGGIVIVYLSSAVSVI